MSSLAWYGAMYGVFQAMPEKEKMELHAWERENLDGNKIATSDWPGWEKYIGKPPWKNPMSAEDNKKGGFVYLVFAYTGEYKIGHSENPDGRIKSFVVQPPFEYETIHTFPADDMKQAEIALHGEFASKRIRPNAEWFSLNNDDIDLIRSITGFQNGKFILKENLPS
ncbi:MAG TPA: GIY-YIG nuclease family protein [Candidatus Aquilonibacter sp.]|nr:GIY-YIG nuclease family protein [Candidatus Aquilonibacter sp.]